MRKAKHDPDIGQLNADWLESIVDYRISVVERMSDEYRAWSNR